MVFGWFLIENLTHTLPYSLAWRIHTRLGKNRLSSTSFNRVCSVCGNRATFLFPIRHILIPVEFLSNSFFAFGVGILPLSFLAASMISFSLFPFAKYILNFSIWFIGTSYSTLFSFNSTKISAAWSLLNVSSFKCCCVSDTSVYETYRDGLCYSVFKMETLYPIALNFRLFIPNRTFSRPNTTP